LANVQCKVRDYVTRVNADPTGNPAATGLTVIVTWQSNATHSVATTIGTRSQLCSLTGCPAPTTHPLLRGVQAFLSSDAGTTAGGITVQSSSASYTVVDGVDVVSDGVTLPGISTRTQTEQIVPAQSDATTSALKLTGAAGTPRPGCLPS
jgi:hypothetical protein